MCQGQEACGSVVFGWEEGVILDCVFTNSDLKMLHILPLT